MPDFTARREREGDAHGPAVRARTIQHDAIGGGRDFLKPERARRESGKPRLPVSLQRRPAVEERRAVAGAFEAGVLGMEIEQRNKIALPARIQPIHDDGYLVKILRHCRHAFHMLASLP